MPHFFLTVDLDSKMPHILVKRQLIHMNDPLKQNRSSGFKNPASHQNRSQIKKFPRTPQA
jgi:hypothetical protein